MFITQANVEQGTKYFVPCVETLHGEPKVLNTKVKTKSRPQTTELVAKAIVVRISRLWVRFLLSAPKVFKMASS